MRALREELPAAVLGPRDFGAVGAGSGDAFGRADGRGRRDVIESSGRNDRGAFLTKRRLARPRDRVFRQPAIHYNEEMEQVAKPEPLERSEGAERKRPLVFLDTNVIIGLLHGDSAAAQMFSAESQGRIRFAVNPIVLQELLLAADATGQPEFERIRDHLRVLPVDFEKAEALLPRVRAVRNRLAHSNDILILSSAVECDFFVTRDALLKTLVAAEKPRVVTPEELLTHLRAA